MTLRLLLAGLLVMLALPVSASAFDIDQLMAGLASFKGGQARFVETKYIALLDKPVISSGEMRYVAPDLLEKHALKPKEEILTLDKNKVSIEREGRKLSIDVASQPEALAFVDSIRATMSGNRAALEKSFALHLSGDADKWTLTMITSDPDIAAQVHRIVVNGSGNRVLGIEYLQPDGDRTVLRIEPIDKP